MGIEADPIVANSKNDIGNGIESGDGVTRKLKFRVVRHGSWRRCMVLPLIKHISRVNYD